MTDDELALLRIVAVDGHHAGDSRRRGSAKRHAAYGSPDKIPEVRLDTLRRAGAAQRAVHVRHSDRHRRNPPGADRDHC